MTHDPAPSFDQLRVAAFEARRADDMTRLIERCNGIPSVSPALREVPRENHRPAIDFANRIITGQVDLIIFLTGVGARYLIDMVERHVDRKQLVDAISDIKSLARGPKPVAALKEFGITPTLRVPEPNTWREILTVLDEQLPVANLTVGLQEYGESNPSLIAGLEARGARVDRIRVYDWELPQDTSSLEANIQRILDGKLDVVLFTSAGQIANLLMLTEKMGCTEAWRDALQQVAVASIGPTTSEMLRSRDLPVDIEPDHSRMGQLVQEAARSAHDVLARKRNVANRLSSTRVDATIDRTDTLGSEDPWHDSLFLKACRGEKVDVTPVWLMRQAGRYLPEYRAVRKSTTFLELCRNPQLASAVMCQAVEYLGVDAAIIFSDLLPILEPMGMDLEFAPGDGPIIHNPVRESIDVDRVLELESTAALHFVMETVEQTRRDLPAQLPLIGFAGAPFTLASYAIEGGASRNYLHTKTLMYRDQQAWDTLMGRLARSVVRYLNAQIAAGVQAVQLFDSWVGCLSPNDYRQFVLPYVKQIISELTPGIPLISFATGNPQLLPLLAEAGPDVVGVDWRIDLSAAWHLVGHDRAVQGNLEPLALLADHDEIRRRANDVLRQADGRSGHIFNLGHGVVPQTPPANARALVEIVHELSAARLDRSE